MTIRHCLRCRRLSLVASFSLILLAVGGWAMWRILRSLLETLTATAFVEIP